MRSQDRFRGRPIFSVRRASALCKNRGHLRNRTQDLSTACVALSRFATKDFACDRGPNSRGSVPYTGKLNPQGLREPNRPFARSVLHRMGSRQGIEFPCVARFTKSQGIQVSCLNKVPSIVAYATIEGVAAYATIEGIPAWPPSGPYQTKILS